MDSGGGATNPEDEKKLIAENSCETQRKSKPQFGPSGTEPAADPAPAREKKENRCRHEHSDQGHGKGFDLLNRQLGEGVVESPECGSGANGDVSGKETALRGRFDTVFRAQG